MVDTAEKNWGLIAKRLGKQVKEANSLLKLTHVNDGLPPVDKYVLAAAPSGYMGHPFRFTEAKYNPDYKGWTNVSNDRVTDSGEDVMYWMPLPVIDNG